MHLPQMTLEQHPSLLSSGVENCFSFLVSRLSEAPAKSLSTVAHVQQASAEEDMFFKIESGSRWKFVFF